MPDDEKVRQEGNKSQSRWAESKSIMEKYRLASLSKTRSQKGVTSAIGTAIAFMLLAFLNVSGSVTGEHIFFFALVLILFLMGVSALITHYRKRRIR
jgi:cation transport ATPase